MSGFSAADILHRLVKEALDSGMATSLEQAEAIFRGYRLRISIGEAQARQRDHQAALLTAVALARRVFLGGVSVNGFLDVPLLVDMPLGENLKAAVVGLGGQESEAAGELPCIFIGGEPRPRESGFRVRTVYAGWRAGVVPADAGFAEDAGPVMSLAPMLAAALAVNEAFFYVQGQMPVAGLRSVGLSLWQLGRRNWHAADIDAPVMRYLPSKLWLIGLGHLGQAYLWGLGLLPYPNPTGLSLTLQDCDIVTPSTESTSILSDQTMVSVKKTRAMASWAERRGFTANILERLFAADFQRQEDEPTVALCGLDNGVGRRALDQVGFSLVIEAGLGRGHQDFRCIRLHTLPATRTAGEIWKAAGHAEDLTHQPAYQHMMHEGTLDRCGATLLAGKAIGAPFVGAVAASLVLGELLRFLHGGPLHRLIDLDLKAPDYRTVVPQTSDFCDFNPGYVQAN